MADSAAAGGAQAALRTMDKVIVAIHGVGSQQRSETIRRVTTQFIAHSKPRVALMPLGFFYVDKVGQVKVSQLDVPAGDTHDKIGFAEVFWADIPKKLDKDSDGVLLDFGAERVVLSPSEPLIEFPGEAAVHATIHAGITTDFNVMTRRGRCRHRLERTLVRDSSV